MLFYWILRSRSGDEPGFHQFTGVQFDVCGGHVCHSDYCQSVLQESEQTHWTGAREQDLCWQHVHCLDNQVMGVQTEATRNGSFVGVSVACPNQREDLEKPPSYYLPFSLSVRETFWLSLVGGFSFNVTGDDWFSLKVKTGITRLEEGWHYNTSCCTNKVKKGFLVFGGTMFDPSRGLPILLQVKTVKLWNV